jgi:hypothetical protein
METDIRVFFFTATGCHGKLSRKHGVAADKVIGELWQGNGGKGMCRAQFHVRKGEQNDILVPLNT